ncbi:hypothetical protein ICJ55_03205 [Mannheimia bovis]|uniref:Type II secretory pathway, component PulJ n=1 Tax=Mannheimia bovis TaxID=2770636 RepID=A0A7H1C5D4_9PAST|nr:hypothetical protein ICJ55_03205 [Mannheimia bovis]
MTTALGAFVLLVFASSYTDFYRSQIKQRELLALQADAHQIINYFQQHFQHIGYQGSKRGDSNFDLFQLNGKSVNIPNKHCIMSFYDVNQDGCLGKRRTKTTACKLGDLNNTRDILKEIFAFKLENNEIYTFSQKLDDCVQESCLKLLESCNGAWSKFTEINSVKVNKLNFNWKKQDILLEVEIELESVKERNLIYSAKSYIFLLNY